MLDETLLSVVVERGVVSECVKRTPVHEELKESFCRQLTPSPESDIPCS